jgi:lysophospholipid hydrolase
MLFVVSVIALNYWMRSRYQNEYASLKEPPLIKPDVNELHPDINSPEAPHNFHNYLDDFLQAVRVFGFLEKPVCGVYSMLFVPPLNVCVVPGC